MAPEFLHKVGGGSEICMEGVGGNPGVDLELLLHYKHVARKKSNGLVIDVVTLQGLEMGQKVSKGPHPSSPQHPPIPRSLISLSSFTSKSFSPEIHQPKFLSTPDLLLPHPCRS